MVSSSSRGIGLEFTRQLLEKGYTVIGLQRSEDNPLRQSGAAERLHILSGVDLERQETLDTLHSRVKQLIDDSAQGVDLLVNASALLGDGVTTVGPERTVAKMDRAFLQQSFDINLFGHVLVTTQMLPLLKAGASLAAPARVVNMSARVGSISDNALGGWYSYRMSKAALNMFTRTLSIELKRNHVTVLSLHPGTTDTDLSKPFQKNVKPDKLQTVETAVKSMLQVILHADMESSGKFFAYDGSEIPY